MLSKDLIKIQIKVDKIEGIEFEIIQKLFLI